MRNYYIFAGILACLTLTLAIFAVANPLQKRDELLDAVVVSDFGMLESRINKYYNANNKNLPSDLSKLEIITGSTVKTTYEYKVLTKTTYSLCATFLTDSSMTSPEGYTPTKAYHPKGHYCFPYTISDYNVVPSTATPKPTTTPTAVDVGTLGALVSDAHVAVGQQFTFMPTIINKGAKTSVTISYTINGKPVSTPIHMDLIPGQVVSPADVALRYTFKDSSEMTGKRSEVIVTVTAPNDIDLGNNSTSYPFINDSEPLPKFTCSYTDSNNKNGTDDYYSKSSITFNGNPTFYTDYCSDNYLMEYSCKTTSDFDLTAYLCPNGCLNGTCKR